MLDLAWRRPLALAVLIVALAAAVGTGFGLTTAATADGPDALPAHDAGYGAIGPEGPRMRQQLWRLPSGDPGMPLLATLFRPAADNGASMTRHRTATRRATETRRPLVVINHGTDVTVRRTMGMPVIHWLTRWFVERGYVVALPLRRGYGATGGPFVEGRDTCSAPDHRTAGIAAADDIAASIAYLRNEPFVDPDNIVVVGISSGGWASLALAARNPAGVRMVVNFAGGRGAHAWGRPGAICGEGALLDAAARFAHTARMPTLWIYAENDSYFAPPLVHRMHRAWIRAGGSAELSVVPAYRTEGHELVNDAEGWSLWGDTLERFIVSATLMAAKAQVESASGRATAPSVRFPTSTASVAP